jgi:surface antigen
MQVNIRTSIRALCLLMAMVVPAGAVYYPVAATAQDSTPSSPSAAITVQGVRTATLPYGSEATVAWTTSGFDVCSVTPGNWHGTQGVKKIDRVTAKQTYTLTCTGPTHTATAYATYAVLPPTFDYLRSSLKSAETIANRDALNDMSWRVYDANARYQAGKVEQSKHILAATVTRANKLVEKKKLSADAGTKYVSAVAALTASWGKPTPVPDVLPADAIMAVAPNGGYPAQWANPPRGTVIDAWGMFNRESVSYAAWKVYDTYGSMPFWGGNPNQWPDKARGVGIRVDFIAEPRSVAILNRGAYGHAMWVEAVNTDGTVRISQYNNDFTGAYSETTISALQARSLTYIHFK